MGKLPKSMLAICRWARQDGAVLSLLRDGTLWVKEPGSAQSRMVENRRYSPQEADQVAARWKFPPRDSVWS